MGYLLKISKKIGRLLNPFSNKTSINSYYTYISCIHIGTKSQQPNMYKPRMAQDRVGLIKKTADTVM
jgi:hypothetical protein